MSDLQAVLWDMDGTLLDSEKLWDIPLYEYAEKLGGVLSKETRERMVGSNVPTTMRLLFGDVGIEPTEDDMTDGAAWILRRTEEVFRAGLPWRPGAREALRAVRASGVPMALVTSTERKLTEVALDTIGRDLFDVTVCGDEVDGLNKPLPEPYLKAARLLGADPARCVAIEDSPTGVAAAVAAGCTVLVVPCDVEVPAGERRVFRDSLTGVDLDVLRAL
ncbi:haloacid dehalogenase superfamily, subfamily IA, variant 3 with third motif having DD or ED [Lentzea fradiae]|uniref:Haloacid dehalogenase superfamily, subfamily IA, variant 3 with third motif having DD or ED n=1 Tax=Lentzea fradiae TaxID=200378 RepID=A0A1G7K4A7_9PSEU|nr:HAD family phosphatase [Lentzea fradiae]SDF32045.1 haloacid dehalogenase superfamily, subfamily IA, variant 3 with third motif having DD or ED [Lentzea fradiae]